MLGQRTLASSHGFLGFLGMHSDAPQFLFACCQCGAQATLKQEIQRTWPQLRFAYSRPGFVTFKNVSDQPLPIDLELKSVFARTYGFSLGRVEATDPEELARHVCDIVQQSQQPIDAIHIWERDQRLPGERGFQPGPTAETTSLGDQILAAAQARNLCTGPTSVNRPAKLRDHVLDCILIDPGNWYVGHHVATSTVHRQPGGVFHLTLPAHAVSRAYLKMNEALNWSRLPVTPGDACVEIGSAPGGASQALLDRGMVVTGVDPAEMAPGLLEHPKFTHIRKRGSHVKRREYQAFKWLMSDTNSTPTYTLDTVESIVTYQQNNIRGMLLTLKLTDWSLAEQIPEFVQRVISWGYPYVRVRHLAYNRQEVCLAAMKSRSMRRRRKTSIRKSEPLEQEERQPQDESQPA